MTKTFAERCHIAQQFLPEAQYKAMLTALHAEMLAKLADQPAQPAREWVGLTEEEKTELRRKHYPLPLLLMDATEAKLKEKNA